MRGEVLHYDSNMGGGFITGQDGNRYSFTFADMKQAIAPHAGAAVDFRGDGPNARDIFVLGGAQAGGQYAMPNQAFGQQPQAFAQPAYAQAGYGQGGYAPAYRGQAEPDLGLWGYFKRAITDKYASFGGRARRKEYWGYVLFAALFSILISLVIFVGVSMSDFPEMQRLANAPNPDFGAIMATFSPIMWIGVLLVIAYSLALIIPTLAVTVRRFHDVGLSGWLYLLGLVLGIIPLVGFIASIAVFVVTVLDSKPVPNKWGNPPK